MDVAIERVLIDRASFPPLAEISPTFLFAAGLLLVVMMTLRWSRQRKRAGSRGSTASDRCDVNVAPRPESAGACEAQLLELSRDLMGELNTKIAIVEQLTLRAEQQAERLEDLLRRAERLAEQISVE